MPTNEALITTSVSITELKPVAMASFDTKSPLYSEAIKTECVDLKERAEALEQVRSAKSQDAASQLVTEIKEKLNTIEEVRVAVKDPYLQMCNHIDKQTKTLVADLTAQLKRLREAITGFQLAEQRKAELAAQKQADEQARIARETEEAERKRIEAEAKGDTAGAQEAELQQAILQTQAVDASQTITPPKPAGMSATPTWKYSVVGKTTDEMRASMLKLANAFPLMVTIEPRYNDIMRYIKEHEGKCEIPGLKIEPDIRLR